MPRKYVRKNAHDVTRPSGELVDASPAMDHIRALRSKGMPFRAIADAAGVTDKIIRDLHAGERRNSGKVYQVRQCSPKNLAGILAVRFVPGWDPAGFSGVRFREVRESRNMSRPAVARLAGLNESTLIYWETGRSMPTRRPNIEAALKVLEASWEDVCGPPGPAWQPAEPPDLDAYSETFVDEYIPDYPCQVCGHTFRSRRLLAQHPHPKKEKPNALQ